MSQASPAIARPSRAGAIARRAALYIGTSAVAVGAALVLTASPAEAADAGHDGPETRPDQVTLIAGSDFSWE
ncbi:MAG TPA: hypothetical protein VKZ65_11945 [Glycomyces sp.]|nr:hypothetical protein [Glycomyces sp.]